MSDALERQLRELGVADGGIAMVHASMRAVGGRAEALLDALLATLGPEGTLMAYVDFEPTDALPYFDPAHSPACAAYGVIAEAVRRNPRAVRSRNPGASMAAIGARATWLCADHPLRYGYGPGSPLAKLVEADGQVLLLGSHFDHVTLLHYAEHVARLPNKRVITDEVATVDGTLQVEEFDTSAPVVDGMPGDYFDVVTRAFIDAGGARSGTVGNARAFLLPARAFVKFAVEKMERDFT
jgi:aminoglycoside 3-N-acetyltransferase